MTLRDFEACVEEASRRTKATLGHTFVNHLKPECAHCGRTPKAESKCPREQKTFVMRLAEVLMELGAISPNVPDVRPRDG